MLSRLKRRTASTSHGDSSREQTASSPSSAVLVAADRESSEVQPAYAQSPPSSRPESPVRTQKQNRHSFATPVRNQYDDVDEVGRTLSPDRAYYSAGGGGGRASRSSSISSYVPSTGRRSLTLPSPPGAAAAAAANIGHGSLSLDHLAPQDGTQPMTFVVHAPELLPDGAGGADVQEWLDQGDGGATPVMPPGSELQTPLAPPHSSLSTSMNGLAPAVAPSAGQQDRSARSSVEHHRHRALTTGDVRFVPPLKPSSNGLDALAAINVPTGTIIQDILSSSTPRPYPPPRSPSLSPQASRNGSRPASRRSSYTPDDAPLLLRRGRSATTSSPSRGRSKSSSARNGSAAAAAALASSGVALASPKQNLGLPMSRSGSATNGEPPLGGGGTVLHEQQQYDDSLSQPLNHYDAGSAPAMSARNSLESHISPNLLATATDTEEFQEYRSVYGDHGTAFLSMDQLGDFDDVVSQLGTGYAVASSKRNADFHALFKHIPDDDYLIEGASTLSPGLFLPRQQSS